MLNPVACWFQKAGLAVDHANSVLCAAAFLYLHVIMASEGLVLKAEKRAIFYPYPSELKMLTSDGTCTARAHQVIKSLNTQVEHLVGIGIVWGYKVRGADPDAIATTDPTCIFSN